jgi:hypothetical protein
MQVREADTEGIDVRVFLREKNADVFGAFPG